jgi:hypothetical protein
MKLRTNSMPGVLKAGNTVAKMSCWKGCAPKPGTPKTKKSPTRPGVRVNNCDCS